jgi:hypothetical protein
MLYDSAYVKCPEQVNHRDSISGYGTGGKWSKGRLVKDVGFPYGVMENPKI